MGTDLHHHRILESAAFTSAWLAELATTQISLKALGAASLYLEAFYAAEGGTVFAEPALLQVARANGQPFTFRQEDPDVVQRVTSSRTTASSSAGTQALGFHTDFGAPLIQPWSHWDFRPETIVLLCMAAPVTSPVTTTVIKAEELIDRLPAATTQMLCEPEYRFPVSYSMEALPLAERTWSKPGPVLRISPASVEIAVDLPTLQHHRKHPEILDLIVDKLPARQALEELLEAAEGPELGTKVTLTQGSLLVFNNHRTVHARSEHSLAATEPRSLLRVYTSTDQAGLQAAGTAIETLATTSV